jgi:hypothetical protein
MGMAIGPNFGNELAAAGLFALQMAWTPDGSFTYGPAMTSDQTTAVAAVVAAHDPTKPDITQVASVVSTGTSALNGYYAINPTAQQQITSEAIYIQVTGGIASGRFSNGQTTSDWPDAAGAFHTFNLTEFINFAEGIASYFRGVIAGQAAALKQQVPSWPSTVTIP